MIVKMECPHSQESLSELAEILKREVSAELICEELKSLGSGGVLLLAFEKRQLCKPDCYDHRGLRLSVCKHYWFRRRRGYFKC